ADTVAYIHNTTVDAGADLAITAVSAAQINATLSNAASSTASALYGAKSLGFGGLLASNKVNGAAYAYIDESGLTPSATPEVKAGGSIAVTADDAVKIYSNVKMVSSAITTNDGGASILQSSINELIPADFVTTPSDSSSLTNIRDIKFGETVRLASNYAVADFTTSDGLKSLTAGKQVKAEDGTVYRYIGPDASVDLQTADFADTNNWQALAGVANGVYEFMGSDALGTGLDLNGQDYTDRGFWKPIFGTQLIPQGNN